MKSATWTALALALCSVARGEAPPLAPGAETLVILPDTEVYASRKPEILKAQLAWIRDHADARRIKAVLHAGDITNRNTEPEWKVAREAFDPIEGRIPNVLCLGNHDYDGQTGRTSLANRVFRVAELRKSASFGGVFEEDRVDNHFQWINLHGRKWLVLSLEFGPRPAVMEWANRVLELNAAHPAIVLTHGYLFRDNERFDHRRGPQRATPHGAFGDGADGEQLWQQVLRRHANVMLVVCGHVASGFVGYRHDEGDHGNKVHQMMCDYEKLPGGGQGFLRLLEFHPDGKTVQVRTYSPVTGGSNPVNAALEEFVFELRNAPPTPSTEMPDKEVRAGLDPDPKTWRSRPTRTLTSETKLLAAKPVNRYGGWTGETARATGFFRTERDAKGRWRLIDPDGGAFISIGVNSVRANPTTAGRKALSASYDSEEAWAADTAGLLRTAGINTMGAWSDAPAMNQQARPFAYAKQLHWMAEYGARRKGTVPASGHTGFVNDCIFVFDPEFEAFCREKAAGLVATRDDPWLLGYFSDNELPFPEDALDRFLRLPESEAGFRAAREWLRLRRGSDAAVTDALSKEERAAFLTHLASEYFRIVSRVMKEADPNHLYLGCRFHGRALRTEALFRACAPYVDVVSINLYGQWTPDPAMMSRWVEWSGKPFLVSEFYAMAADSGLANETGAGWVVQTQTDRGDFYQHFALSLLRHDGCVGWHWHRYLDNDPADREAERSNVSGNKGIVNIRFEPYSPLLDAMRELNTHTHTLRHDRGDDPRAPAP